ncbi:Glyoxalase/bleomycin resistance protein/dioxygenase [Hyaloraphidium curvatum]|nr:Glyoxalase/bleomycin resistance protein/dioxygenase [Hyaloraphidium curvatum]
MSSNPAQLVGTDPREMHTITPHLVCADAEKAMDWYAKAFGAKDLARLRSPEERLLHGSMELGDSRIMLVDEMPEMGARGPKLLGGSPVTLHISCPNVDAAFARAVEAGAEIVVPVADKFWGDRYGQVRDPWGHEWSMATQIRKVTLEEAEKAMLQAIEARNAGVAAESE